MPFSTKSLIKSGLLAAIVALGISAQYAFAESESGGFVFGDNSESGGPLDTGAESDAGRIKWGENSESGGPLDTGAESDSGGVYQSEAETLSGGATNAGSSSEASVDDHSWGKYVQYYNFK